MNEAVAAAVEQLRNFYGQGNVEALADSEGGAYVLVRNLDIGETYNYPSIWCRFRITYMYPEAQVYPHYINHDIKRKDGKPLGGGFSDPMMWNNHSVVQVSRTSKNWNPALDTAQIKLEKVIQWVKER
jgi:hypothetical protein